jgi:hypothetical protein
MWMCLALLAICLCAARVSQINMDDDNLFLAYAAQSEAERAAPLEQSLIDRIATVSGCEESAYRLSLRKRYSSNYAGYLRAQRILQSIAERFVRPGQASVVAATLGVKAVFFLVGSLALLIIASRVASRDVEAAVVSSFIVLVAMDLVTRWASTVQLVNINSLALTAEQMMASFFVAAKPHSYFGVTPRNAAILVFVVALLLKWQGRLTAATLALLLIAPIHQTYGGLALVMFAAASTISRPTVFATTSRRIILISAGLVYVLREHFLEHLDPWVQAACSLALVAAALLLFRIVCSARFAAVRERILGRWVEREIACDAITLVALVVLITLLSWGGARVTKDALSRRYVWANFPSRALSFVRFPAFIACFWLLSTRLRWAASSKNRARFAATCAVSGLVLSGVCVSQVDVHAWKRLQREVKHQLGPPRDRDAFRPQSEEGRIYAYLAMIAARQRDLVWAEADIVARRPIRCEPSR